MARPVQASFVSAASFAIGSIPSIALMAALGSGVSAMTRIVTSAVLALVLLLVLGIAGARLGGARATRAAVRVVVGGVVAMAVAAWLAFRARAGRGAREAADIGSLAAIHGLDAARLAATVADYNRAARGEGTDPFGRKDFGLAPLDPPYVVTRVVAGLFHTQGGLLVDAQARVLRHSRALAFVAVDVRDEAGGLVAVGRATYSIMRGR